MNVTIYHNPACGTSRNVLGLIRGAGLSLRQILRRRGTPYDALGLEDETLSDDALLKAIAEHPILIERPIVVTERGVRLCRPAETVLDILPGRN